MRKWNRVSEFSVDFKCSLEVFEPMLGKKNNFILVSLRDVSVFIMGTKNSFLFLSSLFQPIQPATR